MSNFYSVPPILPLGGEAAANAPEPDSERAEAEAARPGERLLKEGHVPLDLDNGPPPPQADIAAEVAEEKQVTENLGKTGK